MTKRRGGGHHDPHAPLPTIDRTGNSIGVATAHLAKFRGDSAGSAACEPLPTITAGGEAKRPAGGAHKLGVVTAFIEQANTGLIGHSPRDPLSTIVGKGCTQRIATANLVTMRKNADGADAEAPLGTITAGTVHHGVIECSLSPEAEAGALRVAAFLVNYYGNGQALDLAEPADTITTRDRLALVTVHVRGVPYVIVDIGLRMLKPHELYRAQGFPLDYVIDRTADGRAINGTRAVKMVGNSVSPHPLAALARANLDSAAREQAAA